MEETGFSYTLSLINGKYKMTILYTLMEFKVVRFNDMKRYNMKLINIGFGNLVAAHRLLAVVSPDSAPIKRVIQEARERQMLIDASFGRKTASVLLMDTDHVILSAMTPEVIGQRSQEQLRRYEEDEI